MTCRTCRKTVDPLAVFPGGVCVECYAKTAEGQRQVTAEELVEMWGGQRRKPRPKGARTMTRRGSAVSYRAFTRTWWRRNPAWPGGREPGAGRKTTLARHLTEDEARRVCATYNASHDPGPLSRKAEYEQE